MVDIRSAAAEIRRGKKKKDRKQETTGQKYKNEAIHRNFLREERELGLRVGQIIALPAKIRRWLI